MSATSALENNEDLENIPLVRMADVQPDRSSEMYLINNKKLVSSFPCGDDEDCNIGSMVSIQSEEIVDEESNETELILPESVDSVSEDVTVIEKEYKISNPEQWPTLEILPGGVIKYADRYEEDLTCYQNDIESNCQDMMYACAKCPQRFNFLFSLVKHVKLHEIQKKKEQEIELIAIKNLVSSSTQKLIPAPQIKIRKHGCPHKNKKKGISKLKTKCKVPKRS